MRSSMSLRDTSMYTATHQVLFHYLVNRLGCQEAEASLTLAQSFCNNIIQESGALHRKVLTMHTGKEMMSHCYIDLWLEQGISRVEAFN